MTSPVDYRTEPELYRHWQLEIQGNRATLVLQVDEHAGLRPGYQLKLNSYDLGVDIELADVLNRIRFEHPQVAAVVITSNLPRTFCSGANIFMLAGSSHHWKVNFCKFTNETRNSIEDASKFSDIRFIAAVNGIAIGGGATIPMHCDIVYVTPSLRMRLPFVNLGLVPEFASSYMLQANIGARRAAELMYTAKWIDADLAFETGIATAIVPEEALMERAMETAKEIAQWPVGALKATKQCLKKPHEAPIREALAIESQLMEQQAGSPENIEAVMAFMEKRAPDFKKLR